MFGTKKINKKTKFKKKIIFFYQLFVPFFFGNVVIHDGIIDCKVVRLSMKHLIPCGILFIYPLILP